MRSVLVTGVQGVGKSTVAEDAARILDVECWNYADFMLRVDPDLGNKDDIRRLDAERRTAIYHRVDVLLDQLFDPSSGRDQYVLLENHLSIVDATGIHTFPHEHVHRYRPLGLAIIEGDPDAIVARRRQDQKRDDRRLGTPAEVREQQAVNRAEAALIAAEFGIPMFVISNDGDPGRVARALANFARGALDG